jgi:hypothetical protein
LTAPNGKPSNLNADDHALVRTPEFKEWAGDWEALSSQVHQKILGESAIDALIAQKGGEIVAMNRPGLGDITFLYGTPGKLNKKGRLVGGGGLSHLIEQRNLEGNDGIAVAKMMPSVIAHGRIIERQSPETTGERVKIVYQNHTAILSRYRNGEPSSWLLTGWENEEGGAGVNPDTAYAPAPSGISEQVGASYGIDALNSHLVNPESIKISVDENGEPLASEVARYRQENGPADSATILPAKPSSKRRPALPPMEKRIEASLDQFHPTTLFSTTVIASPASSAARRALDSSILRRNSSRGTKSVAEFWSIANRSLYFRGASLAQYHFAASSLRRPRPASSAVQAASNPRSKTASAWAARASEYFLAKSGFSPSHR